MQRTMSRRVFKFTLQVHLLKILDEFKSQQSCPQGKGQRKIMGMNNNVSVGAGFPMQGTTSLKCSTERNILKNQAQGGTAMC